MIATVRIATVEQWCESAKRQSSLPPGTMIPILTETMFEYDPKMHRDGCGGKAWIVEREWSARRHADLGLPPSLCTGVCEHMLEMD